MIDTDWDDMDEIAASTIRLNLSDSVLQNLESKDCKTAKEIWDTLEKLYMSALFIAYIMSQSYRA